MKQNQQFRAVGLILLVMALIIFASSLTQQTGLFGDEMTHQEFMVAVENKAIEFVRINQNQQPPTGSLEIWLTDGDKTVLAVSDVIGPWGDRKRESRLVFIGRNLPEEAIRRGLETCLA